MDLLLVILLALLFATILTGPVGWRHHRTENWAGAWLFMLLIFIPLLWLTILWIPPGGPLIMGVSWVAPVLVGLLLALLLASTAPPPRRLPPRREPVAGEDQLAEAGIAAIFIDIVFILFLVGALALLIAGLVS